MVPERSLAQGHPARSRALGALGLALLAALAAVALAPRESDERSRRLPAAANGRIERLEPRADGSWSMVFLADVQGGFERVYRIRPFPVGRSELMPLALAAALPYAPLALLVMPLSEILKKLLGALT